MANPEPYSILRRFRTAIKLTTWITLSIIIGGVILIFAASKLPGNYAGADTETDTILDLAQPTRINGRVDYKHYWLNLDEYTPSLGNLLPGGEHDPNPGSYSTFETQMSASMFVDQLVEHYNGDDDVVYAAYCSTVDKCTLGVDFTTEYSTLLIPRSRHMHAVIDYTPLKDREGYSAVEVRVDDGHKWSDVFTNKDNLLKNGTHKHVGVDSLSNKPLVAYRFTDADRLDPALFPRYDTESWRSDADKKKDDILQRGGEKMEEFTRKLEEHNTSEKLGGFFDKLTGDEDNN